MARYGIKSIALQGWAIGRRPEENKSVFASGFLLTGRLPARDKRQGIYHGCRPDVAEGAAAATSISC